jgi:hypothetical protein
LKLIVLFAALLCVAAARAERIVSVDAFDLSYTGGFLMKKDSGKSGIKDRKTNEFKLNLNFAQTIAQYPNLMFKAIARYENSTVDQGGKDRNSIFALSGGLLYNFDHQNLGDSIFTGFQVGLEQQTLDLGKDESGLNMIISGEFGKRWNMGSYSMTKISYAPTVEAVYRRYGGDIRDTYFKDGTELKINFLKFDILF